MAVQFRPDPLLEQIKQGLQYSILTYSITGSNVLIPILEARGGRVGIAASYTRNGGQIRTSLGIVLASMPSTVSNFLVLAATVVPAITGQLFFSDSVGVPHTLRILDLWVDE